MSPPPLRRQLPVSLRVRIASKIRTSKNVFEWTGEESVGARAKRKRSRRLLGEIAGEPHCLCNSVAESTPRHALFSCSQDSSRIVDRYFEAADVGADMCGKIENLLRRSYVTPLECRLHRTGTSPSGITAMVHSQPKLTLPTSHPQCFFLGGSAPKKTKKVFFWVSGAKRRVFFWVFFWVNRPRSGRSFFFG